ncbi:MAG: hypothetical protein IJZ35_04055 [Clostridia bacterium]|nr:hypothetical protein [Clostridia bacterium]
MKAAEIYNKLQKDKKTVFIIAAGIIGIIFLAISNFTAQDSINTNEDKTQSEQTETSITVEQIEKRLEERLCDTISQVYGAGSVTVMVSVASAGEYVYAKNDKSENDTDSSLLESEIVIYDAGDTDSGLIVSINSPEVLGVAVICEGGGSAVIKSEITQLVTSLFGIGSDRVYVGSKNSK